MRERGRPRRLIGRDAVVDRLDRRLARAVGDDVLWFFFWLLFLVYEIIF